MGKMSKEEQELETRIQRDIIKSLQELWIEKCEEYDKPASVFEALLYGWTDLAMEVKKNQPKFWESFIKNCWSRIDRILRSEDTKAEIQKIHNEMDVN